MQAFFDLFLAELNLFAVSEYTYLLMGIFFVMWCGSFIYRIIRGSY